MIGGGWITYFCQESRGSNKIYWCLCKNTFYSKAAILALCCSKFKNSIFRSSHQTCSMKKAVLKNFAIFTGKYLSWNIFLIILRALAWNLIKKRLQHRCFPGNIAKFLRTHILNNICKQLLLKLPDCLFTNNLVWRSKKCSRSSLVHKAGHVSWMKDAACEK